MNQYFESNPEFYYKPSSSQEYYAYPSLGYTGIFNPYSQSITQFQKYPKDSSRNYEEEIKNNIPIVNTDQMIQGIEKREKTEINNVKNQKSDLLIKIGLIVIFVLAILIIIFKQKLKKKANKFIIGD